MSPGLDQKSGVSCPNCGQTNPDGWLVCGGCHAPLRSDAADPAGHAETSLPRARHHRITSRLALLSLACGVVGIFAPAGLFAIFFGHVAQLQIHRNRDRYRGRDVAKLGVILGYTGVAIFAVLVFGLKSVGYLSWTPQNMAKTSAPSPGSEKYDPYYRAIRNRPAMSPAERENKGVALIQSLQQAETRYKTAHPAVGYTCVLEDLFQSGFDEGMLQLSIDTGYTLSITDCRSNLKGVRESYRAFAAPPSGGNGTSICADESGVIRTSNAQSNDACFESGKPIAIQ